MTLTRRQSNAQPDPNQFEYDGLFQWGASKQNLTVQEVATGLGIGDKQVLALLDEGYLYAAPINDRLDSPARSALECGGMTPLSPVATSRDVPPARSALPAPSSRLHRRIARFSVLAFYYERLEGQGQPVPFRQTPEITWWRNQLRQRSGLPALTPHASSASNANTPHAANQNHRS